MARPHHIYTQEQLLALQESPLITKPENLPRIDQWIEATTETTQRKPRLQSGAQHAKVEENDNPSKRPSLFESRQRQGHSYSANEDFFLGPKMSFASASAARQHSKKVAAEERSIPGGDERFDRYASRDRYRKDAPGQKDRDRQAQDAEPPHGYRSRFVRQNGLHEDEEQPGKRTGDFNSDKAKDSREGGVALESRRTGPSRARLDLPWHRPEVRNLERSGDGEKETLDARSWRDGNDRRSDRWHGREPRAERDPQWMNESATNQAEFSSLDDIERWKEKMKAGTDPKPLPTEKADSDSHDTDPPTQLQPEKSQNIVVPDEGIFGIWGGQKHESQKIEPPASTAKPSAKPKASRFAGMFKPNPAYEEPSPEEPKSPVPAQPQKLAEDQEGFERMMQMLRMGASSSQGPQLQAFGRPPSGQFAGKSVTPKSPMLQQEKGLPQPQNAPESNAAPPQQSQSRDSQFLLKLMQQPQMPNNQGDVYSHNPSRNETDTSPASPNQRQEDPRSRALPPGLHTHNVGFPGNQSVEAQGRTESQARHVQQMSGEERFGGPPQQQFKTHHQHQQQQQQQYPQLQRFNSGDDQHPNQPPMFDQFSPSNPRNMQQPSQHPGQDGIGPPPGFQPSRGQGPPQFPPFPGPNQAGPQPYGNGPPPPPNMRAGPMQPPHPQQPPPGFYNGLQPPPPPPPGMPGQAFPPGFGPPPPPPQMNNTRPHGQQQMRPPPGMPPGQEMYSEGPRRGQPVGPGQGQMQSQWPPQFLKNINAGYQ